MFFVYEGVHSVTIGEKNTWKDWHLIPSMRPSFSPPLPKNNFIDLPGGSGTLDLSESLTGYPLYNDRTGSWEFVLADQETPYQDVYSEIMNYLQGRRYKAILEDDKYFCYDGKFWINEERSASEYSVIVIEYNVYPYKLERNTSNEPWLWDPFDFKYGVIRNFQSIVVNGTLTVILPKSEMPSSPIITANSNGMKVQCNGTTYDLNNGKTIIPNIVVNEKEITLLFTGIGTISINYQGGRL